MANDTNPYAFTLHDLNGGKREFRFSTKRAMMQAVKCLRGTGGDRAFTSADGEHAVLPNGQILSSVGPEKRLIYTQAELDAEAQAPAADTHAGMRGLGARAAGETALEPVKEGMHTGENPVKVAKPNGMSGPLGAAPVR